MTEQAQIFKGCLKRWDDEKGFGFIMPETVNKDVFIHISALQTVTRRPIVGDIIYYELHTDNKGKTKAVKAHIEGMAQKTATRSVKSNPSMRVNAQFQPKKKNNWLLQLLGVSLLGIIGAIAYQLLPEAETPQRAFTTSPASSAESSHIAPAPQYHCAGKQHCSEMSSCAEALFYLQNCPNTKLDGDNDGRPCESRCN